METVAVVRFEGTDALVPARLVEAARTFALESRAQRTRAAYRLAVGQFNAWCEERRLAALPAAPETVALYLADRASAGRRVATVELDAAGIAAAHRAAGHASPGTTSRSRPSWRASGALWASLRGRSDPPWLPTCGRWLAPFLRAYRASETAPCCSWASPVPSAGRSWSVSTWKTSRSGRTA